MSLAQQRVAQMFLASEPSSPPVDQLQVGNVGVYTRLPACKADSSGPAACWRIELHRLADGRPLGYEVVGDVVIGGGDEAHIDLSQFQGGQHDLAPRHALLRPTAEKLFLIDLRSPAGTYVNNLPVIYGEAVPLSDGMQVSLGGLSFEIRLIDRQAQRVQPAIS